MNEHTTITEATLQSIADDYKRGHKIADIANRYGVAQLYELIAAQAKRIEELEAQLHDHKGGRRTAK